MKKTLNVVRYALVSLCSFLFIGSAWAATQDEVGETPYSWVTFNELPAGAVAANTTAANQGSNTTGMTLPAGTAVQVATGNMAYQFGTTSTTPSNFIPGSSSLNNTTYVTFLNLNGGTYNNSKIWGANGQAYSGLGLCVSGSGSSYKVLFVRHAGGSIQTQKFEYTVPADKITGFHCYAVTVDGNRKCHCYVDGADVSGEIDLGLPTSQNGMFGWGQLSNSGANNSVANGLQVSDFRMYTKVLSAAQLKTIAGPERFYDAKWGNMGAAPSTPGVTTGSFSGGAYSGFTFNLATTDNISPKEIGERGTVKIKKLTLVNRSGYDASEISKIRLTQGDKIVDGAVEFKSGNIVIYGNQYPGTSGHYWTQKSGYYVATFTSEVEFDVSQNITFALLNSADQVTSYQLCMMQPANSVLTTSNGWSPAIEIVGDFTYYTDPNLATRMFSDKLAADSATVPAGTYGDIEVPGCGYKATAYSAVTAITPAEGSLDGLIGRPNWTYLLTSTVSGWFKIGNLPTGADATIYGYTRGGGSCSMRVAVTPEGKLKIGKGKGNNVDTWDSGDRSGSVTTDIDVPINQWFYLTVAGQRKPEQNTGDSRMALTVFINGEQKFAQENCFLNDGDNGSSNTFVIGAGVSAAGLYGDTAAITDVAKITNWATNEALVEAAPPKATVTIDTSVGMQYWSEIQWDDLEPSEDVQAEITITGGGTLYIMQDENIAANGIIFKGSGEVVFSVADPTVNSYDGGDITTAIPLNLTTATAINVNAGANAITYKNNGSAEIAPSIATIGLITIGGPGVIAPTSMPYDNFTIAANGKLKVNVSSAMTINGIAGAGTFIKTGTAELTLNNKAGGYAVDGGTLEIAQGNVKMNAGNNVDPQVQNATIVIGANGSLNQNGWFNVYGTITFDLAADKSVFNSTIRTYDGTRTLVKKGAGTLTFGAGCDGSGFGTIVIEEGAVAFAGKEGFIKSDATFDFTAHNKTSAAISGNFTFSDTYTFKFPADWAAGEIFQLCSGTLSGIPEGGKITDYTFYLGDVETTATFNLASNGSVFYNTGVKQIAPEGDYTISTLNDEEITEGQTVELTMTAGSTLTIDAVAKARTSVLCNGILYIVGADGAEPTAAQLAALNFEGVTGTIVKKWLATMGVINLNICSGGNKFSDSDASDDGLLAGNTPKLSWVNITGMDSTAITTGWDAGKQEAFAISDMSMSMVGGTLYGGGVSDIPVLKTYLDESGDTGNQIVLTGIPFEMYDIIVYLDNDTNDTIPFHPIHVNGFAYTWDAEQNETVIGTDTDYWGHRQRSGVTYGGNALRISDLSGDDVTIITGKRDNSKARGAIAAIQIVEVPTKEIRNHYEAEEDVDVKTSDLNAYIDGTYTGPFTLTLNGGKFIADTDFVCSALAINSATDLTIEKATDYTIPAAEIAKIAINEFGGDKITFTNLAVIPASAPAAGKTYHWEGDMTLPAIPYVGSAYSGMLDIACDVAGSEGSVYVTGNKSMTFSDGASYETLSFVLGNNGQVTQNFTQNGGALEFTKTGSGTTTSSAFVIAHYNSTVTYNLVGGTITVPNDNTVLGWDGKATLTIGGGTAAALLKTKGIANNSGHNGNDNVLTISPNGTLSLGEYGAGLQSRTQVKLNGGTIEAYETCTFAAANANGIQVTADSTINIPENVTLTISAPLTGSGNITKTGLGKIVFAGSRANYTGTITIAEGSYDIGKVRDYLAIGNIVTSGTGFITATAVLADDGEVNVINVPAGTKLTIYDIDGTTVLESKVEGTTVTAKSSISVKGTACWYDFAFNGNRNSTGYAGGAISKDGGDLGDDPANFHQIPGSEPAEYDAVYTASHPYMGITYPTEWSAAVVATMPDYPNAILMTFGTLSGGLIGLAYGETTDEVLLVKTTGDKQFEVLTRMSVPNATKVKHLYVFSKTAREIKVYLDGKLWQVYNVKEGDPDISFGNGFQIGSIHGGIGSTGLIRMEKKAEAGYLPKDYPDEKLLATYIDTLRIFDCVIGPKASAKLSEEFPYISLNGLYTRTLDGTDATWVQEGAWEQVLDGGNVPADVPAEGATAELMATADTTIAINLDEGATTEAITIDEGSKITFALAEGKTAKVSNSGLTEINAPVVIACDALDITGGPLSIGENGSLTFDCASISLAGIYSNDFIPLTGLVTEAFDEGKIDAINIQDTKPGLSAEFGYDTELQKYGIKVAVSREEPLTLYLTADATLADDTFFATEEGGTADTLRLFAEDKVNIPTGITMTLPTAALTIPLGTIIGEGTVVADGALPTACQPSFQTDTWTGTLYLKGFNWNDFGFGAYGYAGSKIKLTGITGFGPKTTDDGANPEIILEDADEAKALLINNGYSNMAYFFSKVSGSGTFGWDPAATAGPGNGHAYIFKDISNFTGVLDAGPFLKIVVGDTTAGADKGSITFADGIEVKANLGWKAQKAYFGETLAVEGGAVGDTLVSGLTAAPTSLPTVTINGDNRIYTLKYAEGNLVIAYPDIEVSIPTVEGATPSVEGYTITDNKIVVPYNSSFTLVYTADEGKVFTDGTTEKSFECTDVTTAPEIDVSGIATRDTIVKIGDTYYDTLAEAIAAAGEGAQIDLLANVTIGGITIPSGKNFVLEFNSKSITFECPGAGSEGTKTIGFQILEGSTIVFQNGTIQCSEANASKTWEKDSTEKGIAMIIQNYADLTLDGMQINGTYIAHNGVPSRYVLSINSGNVKILDSWIYATGDDFAFDTCDDDMYTGIPTVVVDGEGIIGSAIVGKVELSGGNLNLVHGSIDGELVATAIGDGEITKEDAFNVDAPEGYLWKDGKLVKAEAETGSKLYSTLKEAIDAAGYSAVVYLLKDVELEECISVSKPVALDIGEFNITPKGEFTTGLTRDALFAVRYGGALDISGTGGSINSSTVPSAIKLTENGETSDGEDVASLTVNEGVTITGYYYGICGNGKRGYTEIIINDGTITAAAPDTNLAIFNPQPNSTVTINGGTLIGLDSAIEMRGGSLEVTGGTLTATATAYTVTASPSGTTTVGAAVAVAQHTTKGEIYVLICDAVLKGERAVSVANPQGNETDNVTVELCYATYLNREDETGSLAFDADGNATVRNEGAEIEIPEGYEWKDGVLTAIYPEAKVEPTTVDGFDFAFIYTAQNDAPVYNDAVASFVLTANKAIPADAVKIGGKFSTMDWNIYNLPALEANTEYKVTEATWSQVKAISPFTCGAASVALTEDTEVTLTLKLGDDVIDTQIITLKGKAIEPVDPEEPKEYDDDEKAAEAAAKMNGEDGKIKPEYINAPTGIDKAEYAKLFTAVAEGTTVTVQLTVDAKGEIAEELKDANEATILTPDEEGKATITAKPGLYYGIAAEGSLADMATAEGQNWVMATGTEVKVEVPTVTDEEGNKAKAAFFRPTCSVKDPRK